MSIKEKRAMRRRKREQRYKERRRAIAEYAKDILESENFKKSGRFMQHGTISVRKHSISVAECSLEMEKKLNRLGISCHERELVRGALLHDYFLYDWHDPKSHRRLHGFHHPAVALENASREYTVSPREADIISKHMWPLTLKVPACREAWIVTAADKYCSARETLFCRKKIPVRAVRGGSFGNDGSRRGLY